MLATWRSAPDHLSLVSVELKSVATTCPRRLCIQKHGSVAGNSHQADISRKYECHRLRGEGPGRVHEPVEANLRCEEEQTESAQEPIPVELLRCMVSKITRFYCQPDVTSS